MTIKWAPADVDELERRKPAPVKPEKAIKPKKAKE
jgi:hypothetical protein